MTVDRRQQADLHVAAATAQAEDGVRAGLLAADRVDGDVAAAVGEVGDGGRDVGAVGEHRVLGAEVGGDGEGLGLRSTATTRRPSARAIITALTGRRRRSRAR